jgi:Fur family ferric uptake transcriptional regulator
MKGDLTVSQENLKTDYSEYYEEAKSMYSAFLKKGSMFFTKERELILESVFQQDDHFSADELLFEMQKEGKKVSRATLYRGLHQLHQCGVLMEADFGHGHAHYELALGGKQHIHLICKESEEIKEVESEELEELLQKICEQEGFELGYHKIQLFGVSKSARK